MSLMAKVTRGKNLSNFYILSRKITSSQVNLCDKPIESAKPSAPKSDDVNLSQVVGLSNAVIQEVPAKFVPGTSKSGDYKNPEYFSYHTNSYFEAEIEMLKYRCPQPSALNEN